LSGDPSLDGALFYSGAVLVAVGGAGLAPLAASLLRHCVPERQGFFARWGFSHVALAVLAGFAANLAAGWLLPGSGVLFSLQLTLATLSAVALVALVQARALMPEGARALGFPAVGAETSVTAGRGIAARAVLAGLGTYLLVLPAIIGLELVWPLLAGWLELGRGPSPLLDGILELRGAPLVSALIVCVFVGPFLEELVFRGFLQPLFVQNFSAKGGVLLSAALFAGLHPAHDFLPLLGLATLLGFVMLRTQRLLAPWAVHAAHNALVLLIAFRFPEARELVQ
jgi:membrane protease YdiL (CAAX protease family)